MLGFSESLAYKSIDISQKDILITKKVIFNAKIDCKIPRLFSVIYNTKTFYNNEFLKISTHTEG